ncbi:unnamed protein product, partial [Choristocarpus tenellus]
PWYRRCLVSPSSPFARLHRRSVFGVSHLIRTCSCPRPDFTRTLAAVMTAQPVYASCPRINNFTPFHIELVEDFCLTFLGHTTVLSGA